MAKILVTGGSGFIGSAIVKRILENGDSVNILDNGYRSQIKQTNNNSKYVDYFYGDIRNPELVHEACQGVDLIIHAAYINGTENFYKIPFDILEVGIKGTLNILDAIRLHGIKKVIYISSSETYQNATLIPTPEEIPLVIPNIDNPRYSYGGGKIASELLFVNFSKQHDLEYQIIRPHNIYGPNMGFEHVIPQLIKKFYSAKENGVDQIEIQGTGNETRAFCYITDFVDGLIKVWNSREYNQIYNIGTSEEITIYNLCTVINEILGESLKIMPTPVLGGSPTRRCPNLEKISLLGYQPKIDIREGLDHVVPWYWRTFRDGNII